MLSSSKSNLATLGVHTQWLDTPFVKQDEPLNAYETRIKKLDVFHNSSPTKQQIVPDESTTKPVQVTPNPPEPIKHLSAIQPEPVISPIATPTTVKSTTKSARKPPPPPPSRSKSATPITTAPPPNPFQFSNIQSQLQSKLQFQSSPPVYTLPKPPNKRISISSASSTKSMSPVHFSPIATIIPPPPPVAPLTESISAPRIDLLAEIRNHANPLSNEVIHQHNDPPPRTASIAPTNPISNPLLDQMKQSMSNRRTQLGEISSDDGSENWSRSQSTTSPIKLAQWEVVDQIQEEIVPEIESEPEDIFQDAQEDNQPVSPLLNSPLPGIITTQYTALYDFNGQEQGDLQFIVGDVLQSNELNVDSGWMNGMNTRTQEHGQFPISYTQIEKPPPTAYAIALYQFDPVQSNDLGLAIGQQIKILEYDVHSEWLQACTIPPTTSGMVPRNYIKMIYEEDVTIPIPPIINSIISEYKITEHTYVSDLGVVVALHDALMANKIMTTKECHMLFRNIVDIHAMNQLMLRALEKIENNSKHLMKEFVSVLNTYIPSKYTIYNEYCSNQYSSQMTLEYLMTNNTKFNSHISTYMKQPHCRNIAFNAFMLLPMQRITRINLLLKQLVKHSNNALFDEVSSALEQLLSHINKNAMTLESVTKMNELSKILDISELDDFELIGNTKLQTPRVLLHDGILVKNISGRVLHGWLFNDLLLLGELKQATSNKYTYKTYKRPLPFTELINLVRIQDSIEIIRLETYEQIILLRAADKSSHKLWINKIQIAIREFNEQNKMIFENERMITTELSHDKSKSKLEKMMGNMAPEVYVGTIHVTIEYGQHFPNTELKKYFVLVQVGKQRLKTKVVKRGNGKVQINQTLIFSLRSLDDILKVYLYNMTKYGEDVNVGLHEMPLNYLEYYNDNTETELMVVNTGKEAVLGIKLRYKRV